MDEINEPRRRFLIGATSFVAGAGVVGAAIPFIQSWNPSAKARAAGAPIRVNISKIEPGSMITVAWQGKPVWVLRRTTENLDTLALDEHKEELRDPASEVNQQPDYARNPNRSIREDIFVAVGICTHLGCVPNYMPEGAVEVKHALFYCPCHGSKFDMAGRVFQGVPAPLNLVVPKHMYLSDTKLIVGVDEGDA